MKKNRQIKISKKSIFIFKIIVFFSVMGSLRNIYGLNNSLSIVFVKLINGENLNILNNFKLVSIFFIIFSLIVCICLLKKYKKFHILWIVYLLIQFTYFFTDFLISKRLSQEHPLLNFKYISSYNQLIFFCFLELISLIYLYKLIKIKR